MHAELGGNKRLSGGGERCELGKTYGSVGEVRMGKQISQWGRREESRGSSRRKGRGESGFAVVRGMSQITADFSHRYAQIFRTGIQIPRMQIWLLLRVALVDK